METSNNVRNYFLNSLSSSVRENLIGVARTNDNVQIMKNVDAVIRKDVDQLVRDRKVLIISGVGAGHEPMGAGYVGPFMLTASLSGSYFASPSSGQIIRLIEEIADFETPILLIINNYTGDRLNFGLAKEYLTLEGFKNVRLFIFGDDFAPFYRKNSIDLDVERQRRGLAGVMFIIKIAGVLAELGKNIDEIENCLNRLKQMIFTFSVSSSACDIPGHGASFNIDPNEMELGLGVHGESGVKRLQLCSAKETLDLMLKEMIAYLKLNKMLTNSNNRVIVNVNNLGSMTQIEMNVLINEVVEQLTGKHNLIIERFFSGAFMTSFNMKGFSISLMMVDDELLDLFNQGPSPVSCITNAIINHDYIYTSKRKEKCIEDGLNKHKHIDESIFDTLIDSSTFKLIMKNICTTLIEKEQLLNQLDSTVGDSDCGSTIASIAKLIEAEISTESKVSFGKLARLIGEHIGGSSGALYSLLFTAASNYSMERIPAKGSLNDIVSFWLELMRHCIATISKYSGAKPNDRSMIDGLFGIELGLAECMARKCSNVHEIVHLVAESTWKESNKTATMAAKVGRASYVNESLVKEPDAGAIAVAIWMQTIADILSTSN